MKPPITISDSRVLESREVGGGVAVRRRRITSDGRRFTTYERIEKPHLAIIKKDGSQELFDRDKLIGAINRSVGKFLGSDSEIESIVDSVEESLYALGDSTASSKQIGDTVLEKLAETNEVAYVRFASVYHKFKTLDEFEKFLAERKNKKG